MNHPMTIDTEHPYLEIQGRHSLKGEVKISGAKNAALVIMAGALLCSDECQIGNVPALADIDWTALVLKQVIDRCLSKIWVKTPSF